MPAPTATLYDNYRARVRSEWILSGDAARERALKFEADCRDHKSGWVEFKRRTEKKLFAARLARKAATPPPPSGAGWRVLADPRRPHEQLETLARGLWDVLMHGATWPGLRVRWAALADAQGMYVAKESLILVDEGRYLEGDRTADELETTLVHELSHHLHPGEVHGPAFKETLARALAYLKSLKEPELVPVPPRVPAALPRPWPTRPQPVAAAAVQGPRWGPRWGTGADEWEYRG